MVVLPRPTAVMTDLLNVTWHCGVVAAVLPPQLLSTLFLSRLCAEISPDDCKLSQHYLLRNQQFVNQDFPISVGEQ